MNQIPTDIGSCVATCNTKQAALLYALAECKPHLTRGVPSARWEQQEREKARCWFFFEAGKLATQIHGAFNDPDFERNNAGAVIPDEHMPAVLALIKTMWHNWERLREVTSEGPTSALPLHYVAHRNNKLYIGTRPQEAK